MPQERVPRAGASVVVVKRVYISNAHLDAIIRVMAHAALNGDDAAAEVESWASNVRRVRQTR